MSTLKTRRSFRAALAVSTIAAALLAPTVAPADTDDDDLTQRIDPNQSQGTGQVVIDRGHVDFGPTLNTGEWRIQIHDDSASPSFWRHLDDVVMKVDDAGILEVPESPAYEFLGQAPGTPVWVVPQTQKADVVWAGWNTQEPGVLSALKVGTTLSIRGVEGPGDVIAYLQSGNFGDPQMLWSTRAEFPQQTWIEVNTHTHANWVFTEPGIYLIDVEFSGELNTGEAVAAQDTLRFAVGDSTDPQPAFSMTSSERDQPSAPAEPSEPEPPAAAGEQAADLGPVIVVVVGAVGFVLVVATIVIGVATRRAKSSVLAARRSKESAE